MLSWNTRLDLAGLPCTWLACCQLGTGPSGKVSPRCKGHLQPAERCARLLALLGGHTCQVPAQLPESEGRGGLQAFGSKVIESRMMTMQLMPHGG